MLIRLNPLDEEAYARGRRCGRLIPRPEDFHQAKMNLDLRNYYERIVDIPLSRNPKANLGLTAKVCRYCLRPKTRSMFRLKAHAIPESLGNKHLISHDECDNCNKAFSVGFETQLDHFTLPFRALLGISGKNGVPKYESEGRMAWYDRAKQNFVVIDREGYPRLLQHDPVSGQKIFRLECHEFRPLDVYRALVKIGFSLLDTSGLKRYDYLREWLLSKQAEPRLLAGIYGVVHFSYSFTAAKHPSVCVWERKWHGIPYPSLLVGITLPHLAFAFAMPPGPNDLVQVGAKMLLPRFDLSHQPGWTSTLWDEMDMRGAELKKDGRFNVVLTGGTAGESISNDDWFVGTGYSLDRYHKRWGVSPLKRG